MLLIILGALLVLGLSIFIHELGHLLCGKLVGVQARIFSIGYGKGIWKKRIGNTIYQITSIPFGGYVMFKGDRHGKTKGKKGELLSTPPLLRIIPVLGGPLFNFLLGLLLYFVIALMGEKSPSNEVYIDPLLQEYSAAYKAGIRTGDKILSINGIPTQNFEDIFVNTTFSKGEVIQVQYERNGETYVVSLHPEISEMGMPTLGIEPAAERRVVANFSYSEQIKYFFKKLFSQQENSFENQELSFQYQNLRRRAIQYLKDGDEILLVNGKAVHTVRELQTILGEYSGQEVTLLVNRKKHPLLTPFAREEVEVRVPVLASKILELSNIRDVNFPELKVPFYQLVAHDPKIEQKLSSLRINGKSFEKFSELIAYLENRKSNKIEIEVKALPLTAEYKIRKIGLLGFQADLKMDYPQSEGKNLFQAIAFAFTKIAENISTTFRALKLMFTGFLSPKNSLTGPVGIVHAAGAVVEHGIHAYLDFFARISIALMIVNLLPIPMADGGHVLFYLYEAIAGKPPSPKVIDTLLKLGLIFLLTLAFYVTFYDIMRTF